MPVLSAERRLEAMAYVRRSRSRSPRTRAERETADIWRRWHALQEVKLTPLADEKAEKLRERLLTNRVEWMPLLAHSDCTWIAQEFGDCLALALCAVSGEGEDKLSSTSAFEDGDDVHQLRKLLSEHGKEDEPWVPSLIAWNERVLAPLVFGQARG